MTLKNYKVTISGQGKRCLKLQLTMILKLGFLINTHSEKTLIRQLPCLEDVLDTL